MGLLEQQVAAQAFEEAAVYLGLASLTPRRRTASAKVASPVFPK